MRSCAVFFALLALAAVFGPSSAAPSKGQVHRAKRNLWWQNVEPGPNTTEQPQTQSPPATDTPDQEFWFTTEDTPAAETRPDEDDRVRDEFNLLVALLKHSIMYALENSGHYTFADFVHGTGTFLSYLFERLDFESKEKLVKALVKLLEGLNVSLEPVTDVPLDPVPPMLL